MTSNSQTPSFLNSLILFCLPFLQLSVSAVPSWVDWLQQLEMPQSQNGIAPLKSLSNRTKQQCYTLTWSLPYKCTTKGLTNTNTQTDRRKCGYFNVTHVDKFPINLSPYLLNIFINKKTEQTIYSCSLCMFSLPELLSNWVPTSLNVLSTCICMFCKTVSISPSLYTNYQMLITKLGII